MLRFLALVLLLYSCGAPESIEFGYGHIWNTAGTAYNEHQIVGLDMGDSDTGWVAVTFPLGAKPVYNRAPILMRSDPIKIHQDPEPAPVVVEPPKELPVEPDIIKLPPVEGIMGWLKFLDGLGLVLQIGAVVIAIGALYWYRLPVTEWLKKILRVNHKPERPVGPGTLGPLPPPGPPNPRPPPGAPDKCDD